MITYTKPRESPDLGAPAPPATPEDATLLVRTLREMQDNRGRTARRDVDVHTALTRALRMYLETLEGEHEGRPLRFARVTEDMPEVWAEGGEHPAAAVWGDQDGTYGDQVGAGAAAVEVATESTDPSRATFLQHRGEFATVLSLRAYCSDKEQRIGVRKMLDAAVTPVSWSGGFALRMPFHHAAIGSYLVQSARMFEDDLLGPGLRLVQFTIKARAPWLTLSSAPRYRPPARNADGAVSLSPITQ